MRKIVLVILISILILQMSGCTKERYIEVDGKTQVVSSYGLASLDKKVDGVVYGFSIKNAVIAVLLSETIIVPVLWVCDYIYVPAYN